MLITVDQNMPNQQNLRGRKLFILILCAATNRLRVLAALVPRAKVALHTIGCGAIVVVGFQVR